MKRYIRPVTELTLVSAQTQILAGSFDPAHSMGGGELGEINDGNKDDFTILGKGVDLWADDEGENTGGSSSFNVWED